MKKLTDREKIRNLRSALYFERDRNRRLEREKYQITSDRDRLMRWIHDKFSWWIELQATSAKPCLKFLIREFLIRAFGHLATFSKVKAALYTCYASRTHREFEDALNANAWEVRSQIIWIKTVASLGWSNYRWKHEPILYCSKKGSGVDFYGDRAQYTEWREDLDDDELLARFKAIIEKDETDGTTTVWRVKREVEYKHPTQKPVQLCRIAIANSTRPGDIVLDSFAGSGSTLMAAELTRRRARLAEIDPRFCDVIIERWENFTGKKAELL